MESLLLGNVILVLSFIDYAFVNLKDLFYFQGVVRNFGSRKYQAHWQKNSALKPC